MTSKGTSRRQGQASRPGQSGKPLSEDKAGARPGADARRSHMLPGSSIGARNSKSPVAEQNRYCHDFLGNCSSQWPADLWHTCVLYLMSSSSSSAAAAGLCLFVILALLLLVLLSLTIACAAPGVCTARRRGGLHGSAWELLRVLQMQLSKLWLILPGVICCSRTL